MKDHHLVTVASATLAALIRDGLQAWKRPEQTMLFRVVASGDGHAVYLVTTMPVADEYVHACRGFAEGYREAWNKARDESARLRAKRR